MSGTRPISPKLGVIRRFSYDNLLFEVHDYALYRLPYIDNILASPENVAKQRRRGLQALERINIDPERSIPSLLDIPFAGRHMAMLVRWAYDQDTTRLVKPRGPSFEPNLNLDQWLKLAEFMTIPKLDEDLRFIVESAKATYSQKVIPKPAPIPPVVIHKVTKPERTSRGCLLPICLAFAIIFVGFMACAAEIKIRENMAFYKYHQELAKTTASSIVIPGTPRIVQVDLYRQLEQSQRVLSEHRRFADDRPTRVLLLGANEAVRLIAETVIDGLDKIKEILEGPVNTKPDIELSFNVESRGFISSLINVIKYYLQSFFSFIEAIFYLFTGKV